MNEDEEQAAKESLWASLAAQLEAECMEGDSESEDDQSRVDHYGERRQRSTSLSNAGSVPVGVGNSFAFPSPVRGLVPRQHSAPVSEVPLMGHHPIEPQLPGSSFQDAKSAQLQRDDLQRRQCQEQIPQILQPQPLPENHQPVNNDAQPNNNVTTKSVTLQEWMDSKQARDEENTASSSDALDKIFIEKCVKIAHLLVGELVRSSDLADDSDRKPSGGQGESHILRPRPEDVEFNHIIVIENEQTGAIEDVHFDVLRNFDWAIDHAPHERSAVTDDVVGMLEALGRLFFKLFMKGEDLPRSERGQSVDAALALHPSVFDAHNSVDEEQQNLNLFRDIDESENQHKKKFDRVYTDMKNASVPEPICQMVFDLLRSPSAKSDRKFQDSTFFSTVADVYSDLKQMVECPEAFVYGTLKSRWGIVFGGNHLFGREDEVKVLMDAALRARKTAGTNLPARRMNEALMISGLAGSGKSRLALEVCKPLMADGWLFLRCKFENSIHSEPLSVISMAFNEYFSSMCCQGQQMSSWQDRSLISSPNVVCSCDKVGCPRMLCQKLESVLGLDGLASLSEQIPNMHNLINQMYPSLNIQLASNDSDLSLVTPIQKYRTHYLFVTMLDTLSSLCPVVFFADDLQWADSASVALLTGILTQVGSHFNCNTTVSLLFIGAYRDDEAGNALATMLQAFQASDTMNINRISIDGIPMASLNRMLSEALCLPMRRTKSLSHIVYQKTHGYPLFVAEFLDVLLAEKLITYDASSGWEWDIDAIDKKELSKSVAELLSLKLQRLPHEVLNSLQVLSCFGCRVDAHIINVVKNQDVVTGPVIMTALDAAQKVGLVQITGSTFSFSHDLIQQAAFDLIPSMDRHLLLLRLANCFIGGPSDTQGSNSTLFVAVDLINRIGPDAVSSNVDQSTSFARLNLDAGKKAMAITDFASAVKYCQNGILFLQGQENYWDDHYDLSLGLFENAVAANYCEGNHHTVVTEANAVLDHARSFEDKFKSYCVYINVIALRSMEEAIDKLYYLLACLGENIDPTMITFPMAQADAMEVKQMLLGDQKLLQILHSNRMTDRTKMMTMEVMSMLCRFYNRQRNYLSGYLCGKMLRMSLRYGHSEHTIVALTISAISTLKILRDPAGACSMAQASLSLSKLYQGDRFVPEIFGIVYGFVLVVQQPMHSSLSPLLRSCRVAFSHGNFEYAALNTNFYLARSLYCGVRLDVMMNEVTAFARQHKHNDQLAILQLVLAPILKFLSYMSDTPLDSSDFMLEFVSKSNEDLADIAIFKKEMIYVQLCLYITLMESVFQRDFSRAAENLMKHQQLYASADYDTTFYGGLVAFHMARETREAHWMEKGTNAFDYFELFSKQCPSNFETGHFLLKAEMHHTNGDTAAAVEAYDGAIESARRHNYIHKEALACELAAHYFKKTKAKKRFQEMIQQSHDLYIEWGAHKKAETILELVLTD